MRVASILSIIFPARAEASSGDGGERLRGLSFPALAAASAAGVLLAFAYAQEPFWWAAWLAPALGLAAVLLAPKRWRWWFGLFIGLTGGATSLSYYAVTVASWPLAIALVSGRAILWMWMLNIAARAAEASRPVAAVLVLPVLLVAAETLISRLSPHGAAGSLAYSQMDFLTLLQLASLAGIDGINFIVALGASWLGLMLACAFGWRGRAGMWSATAIAILAVASALVFGQSRLAAAPEVAEGPEVALIAQDRLADRGDVGEFWRAYGQELANAAQPGRIVILPEAILVLPQGIANEVANQLASLARSRSATIVAGLVVEQDGLTTNRALLVQPDGGMVWYYKQHLVPVFESSISPGRSPILLEVAGARTGIAICKDMHFPSLGRDYARHGADLMLVPAADFVVDAWMASRMTVLRGVEGGYAIARTARTGSLTISDRYGRILAEQASGPRAATLIARLPALHRNGPTISVRHGRVFSLLCLLAAAGMLFLLRRNRDQPDSCRPAYRTSSGARARALENR
ncbi:MAG TPA: nitrilase-related carbon-nitrogen hydrolase [Allosphingosinicella sp.]|nr:nitrilase-related carbon-nitrogen hydrolase [Allosphingosinicella sp.]